MATVIPFGVFDADAEALAVVSGLLGGYDLTPAEEPLTTKEGWRRSSDRQSGHARAARPWRGAGSDDGAGARRA